MTISARLQISCTSSEEAERIARALEPDNQDYITVHISENVITAMVTGTTAGSLRHTLDDFLACLSLIERTGEVLK